MGVLEAGIRDSGFAALMPLTLRLATEDDAPALAALHAAVAASLTARFGHGHWSSAATERGVRSSMRQAKCMHWPGASTARDRVTLKLD